MRDEILLGAAGQMFSLQIPETGGLTETPRKFGAVHQGLSGARTVDTLGIRRDYTIEWESLNEDDCSALRQVFALLRESTKPVRLIVPHRKNMLSAAASSGRSVPDPRAITSTYQAADLGVGVALLSVPRPDLDAVYAISPRLPKFTRVTNLATGYLNVWVEGNPDTAPANAIPVVPGRTYTLSVYYRRTASAGFGDGALRFAHRREDGSITGAPTFPLVSLTSSAWTWASVTVTVPSGWPLTYPLITIGQAESIDFAAMQLEEGATRTPWVLGSGVPVVSVTDLQFTDQEWPYRDASLTAIEL